MLIDRWLICLSLAGTTGLLVGHRELEPQRIAMEDSLWVRRIWAAGAPWRSAHGAGPVADGAGANNRAIARQLGIGEGTVRSHVHVLPRKRQVSNRTQAALIWLAATERAG
ncbi:MAG: LuxR C-terminal-related transcriptional regulator [Cyanobacteriota bacterium]